MGPWKIGAEVPKGLGNCSVLEMNWNWMRRDGELARWHKVGDEGHEKGDGEEENPLHTFKDQEH